MTLVTLAVVFAYFTHPRPEDPNDGPKSGGWGWWKTYGFWRSVLIVLSAVPIAILTNALRVSGTGVLAHYYGIEIADGFFHSFSGWVVYIVAFVMLLAVGWIMDRFRPRGQGSSAPVRSGENTSAENGTPEMEASTAAVAPAIQMEGTE